MNDRRTRTRQKSFLQGRIFFNNRRASLDCLVRDFSVHHPDRTVTVLRFVNTLGPGLRTSHSNLLALPFVPGILGFDPRYQFLYEEDMVSALTHAVRHDLGVRVAGVPVDRASHAGRNRRSGLRLSATVMARKCGPSR